MFAQCAYHFLLRVIAKAGILPRISGNSQQENILVLVEREWLA
jgi:hypothetical protein